MRITLVAALAACLSMPAVAMAEIAIEAPWSRATARSATTGIIYFTVVNPSATDDRLVAASSPAAETVELHTHIEEDGIFKMRPVGGVDVPARGRVFFRPGGLHVMLIGLKGALKEGRTVPATLTFEKAGTVDIEARILPVGAPAPQ